MVVNSGLRGWFGRGGGVTLCAASPIVMMRRKCHFLNEYSGRAVSTDESLLSYRSPKVSVSVILSAACAATSSSLSASV